MAPLQNWGTYPGSASHHLGTLGTSLASLGGLSFPGCRRNAGKNKGREGPVPAWGGAVASAGLRGRFLGEHPGCEGVGPAPTQPPKHSPKAFDPRGVRV